MKLQIISTFKNAAMAFAAATLFAHTPVAGAQDDLYIEGGHYELLSEVQPVQTGDSIEVVEMFWYRCPHCYRLEPFMNQWLETKPEEAELVLVPAILNEQWAFHARVYYTLEALGLVDELHAKLFDALHKERKQVNTLDQFADWAADQGADRQAIIDTFDSFGVENKLNFANVMTRKYEITGVPAIIIDGRYRTSVSHAGSHEELLDVINYLIRKAAGERQG